MPVVDGVPDWLEPSELTLNIGGERKTDELMKKKHDDAED